MLRMYDDGSGRRTVVLSEKGESGIDLQQVLRKLHDQSAREVNTHIVKYGIGHRVMPTEGSDYSDDDDDDEDDRGKGDGSKASDTEYENPHDDDDSEQGKSESQGRGNTSTPIRLPWKPGPLPPLISRMPRRACPYPDEGVSQIPVRTRVLPPRPPTQASPYHGSQPSPWRPPPRQPHRGGSSSSSSSATAMAAEASLEASPPPPPPLPSIGRASSTTATSRIVRFEPPMLPPSPLSSPLGGGGGGARPALINVDWVGRCRFSLVDTVPLWRTAVVDAALQAVLERRRRGGDTGLLLAPPPPPPPRLVGTLRRVRLGGCESEVRCLVDDLAPLLRGLASTGSGSSSSITGTTTTGMMGEALPSFDVEIRSGPPRWAGQGRETGSVK